jgi:hypothetical protein
MTKFSKDDLSHDMLTDDELSGDKLYDNKPKSVQVRSALKFVNYV